MWRALADAGARLLLCLPEAPTVAEAAAAVGRRVHTSRSSSGWPRIGLDWVQLHYYYYYTMGSDKHWLVRKFMIMPAH